MADKSDDKGLKSFELLPPEGDQELGKKVFDILGEVVGDKIRQGLHTAWYDRYRLSRNMPWKSDRKKVPLVSANLLHTHRQRTVNTLTDNQPTFNLAKLGAESIENDDAFTKLQWTTEHWWREQEQQSLFEESVNGGEMYGVAIEKVWFDPDLEYGYGEVRTEIIDPYHFGVYPVTAKRNQDAEANLHFYPMSVREARKRWPDKADLIKPDTEIVKELGDDRRAVGSEKQATDTKLQKIYSTIAGLFGSGEDDKLDDRVLICECWVKDGSMTSEVQVAEDGTEILLTAPRYTGGIRRVTVCSAGTVVLDDRDNPNINPNLDPELTRQTYLYDKFPFTLVNSIKDSCSIWGQSDWEQLDGLQKEFSKTLSQFGYFKDRAVRPKIVNPKNSGVGNDEFTNTYGILNPSSAEVGAGIRYLEMNNAGLMREIQGSLNLIRELFFLVAGTFELEQAQTGQVTAYKAIAALLEHAATMMRGKIRNYQKLIRERGRMYISHVQNFYTEERWISYEDDGETQTAPIMGNELIVPAKLTIVSGSTLPRPQLQQREEAQELFSAGAIDHAELLRVLEWPNRTAVLKRMQAGPMGVFLERLGMLGVPPEIMQVIQQIVSLDDKEFEKAMKAGELPQLGLQGQLPAPEGEGMSEVDRAKAEKLYAETELTREKIVSERVMQLVRTSGIQFDTERLELERQKILAQLDKEAAERLKKTPSVNMDPIPSAQTNAPGYNERGMVSNNIDQGLT